MATRCDYQCSQCGQIKEIIRSMHDETPISCPSCQQVMFAYFGRMKAEEMVINYGFRPHRYPNKTDRDIAQFQFTNL